MVDKAENEFDVFLLRALAEDDMSAFDALYARHSRTVLRSAWGLTESAADVEEVVQDTFLTLWQRRKKVRIVDESILPWLLVVCRNHASNLHRRRERQPTVPLDVQQPAEAPSPLQWVHDELDALTTVDREICELCLIAGYSYDEAARMLEISTAAAGKRLERARARLRKAVTTHGE